MDNSGWNTENGGMRKTVAFTLMFVGAVVCAGAVRVTGYAAVVTTVGVGVVLIVAGSRLWPKPNG